MGDSTLPIHCLHCGREYKTLTEFIGLTKAVNEEPSLVEKEQDKEVHLIRLCSCGNEVVIKFRERRDTSKRGEEKRALFDRVQYQLIDEGVQKEAAHEEILNLINGRPCPIMKELAYKELYSEKR